MYALRRYYDFEWAGEGEISSSELLKLRKYVKRCHQENKLIRFWNIPGHLPQSTMFWELFLKERIDLIGVDSPLQFKKFCESSDIV